MGEGRYSLGRSEGGASLALGEERPLTVEIGGRKGGMGLISSRGESVKAKHHDLDEILFWGGGINNA